MIEKYLSKQNISPGGKWYPKNCKPRHHVAILITYRDRMDHLKQILYHLHPILARQELSYGIYLIEPVANINWNKGILFNAGFIESNKDSRNQWECYVLHDIDMLPEDDRIPYSCPEFPTHLSHKINEWNYEYVILIKFYFYF